MNRSNQQQKTAFCSRPLHPVGATLNGEPFPFLILINQGHAHDYDGYGSPSKHAQQGVEVVSGETPAKMVVIKVSPAYTVHVIWG